MAGHAHRANRTPRRLCIQPLESRRCLAAIGFAERPIGGHLLGGSSEMLLADLNGDGHLDFIVPAGWRANDGQGNFGENRLITTQVGRVDHLLASDVDGDGDNDLVSTSWDDDELAWFENRDGQGRFGPKQVIANVNDLTRTLTGGDLDGDGDFDIVRSGARYIDWYENLDASGSFARERLSSDAGSADIIDLDHDGDLDIFTGNGWLENLDGQGQFVERPPLYENDEGHIMIDDLDNNGRFDLIATVSPWTAEWYEATDDPTVFEHRATITNDRFGGDRITWYPGDVDGDGDKDLVAVEYHSAPFISRVHWFELVGTEYIYRQAIESGVGGDWGLIVADLNGDQRDDVLFYPGNGQSFDVPEGPTPTTWQMYQTESRTFGAPIPINEIFDSTTALSTADVDGDGDLDVVHTTVDFSGYFPYDAQVAWIENLDGTGAFGRWKIVYREPQADKVFRRVWSGDIDGDGDVDIVATKSDELVWFENLDGSGNFGGEQRIAGVAPNGALLVHDLDSNGRAELLAATGGTLNSYSYVAPGAPWSLDGAGWQWPGGPDGKLLAGDLDGDGDQDLAFSSVALFSWFERLDEDSFAAGRPLVSVVDPGAPDLVEPELVALADFDGDEDLDVMCSVRRGDARALTWLENKANGQFVAVPGHLDVGSYFSQYAVADVDADDDFDIITYENYSRSELRWLENRPLGDANGDGQFDSADLIHVLAAGKYEDDVPQNSAFAEGDWNGDGEFTTADLVVAFAEGHYVDAGPRL